MSSATTTAAAVVNPRVGGGTDGNTWWTGGTNITASKITKPKTTFAGLPTTFRDAEKVETQSKTGLSEEQKMGLSEEQAYSITLGSCIS